MEAASEIVCYIFGRDELTCIEENIWIALERWVNYGDRNHRMEAASEIMKKIRFGLLEEEYFRRVVRYSSLMMETVGENIEEALGEDRRKEIYLYRPRYPAHVLFAFGGWSEGSVIDTCIMYDWAADTWSNIEIQLPDAWAYVRTVVHGDKIYLCGGHMASPGEWATKQLWTFCPKSMEMQKLSSMKVGRNFPSVAIINNTIYCIGGRASMDSVVRMRSMEIYNISSNQWSKGPNLRQERSDAGSAALGGKVYVVGGFDGMVPLRTVEKYNPSTQALIGPRREGSLETAEVEVDRKTVDEPGAGSGRGEWETDLIINLSDTDTDGSEEEIQIVLFD